MKKVIIIVIAALALFFLLDLAFPFRPTKDYSTTLYDANGYVLATFLNTGDKWRLQAELDDLSEDFIRAILEKEDDAFYYHFGFNPFAVLRAAYQNVTSGEIVSGASTITMQLARLLEPKDRTFLNKIIEVFRAVQLEVHYSKEEILTMYLNRIPFGGNVEGVKSASLFFLGKSPKDLSLAESVCLSFIPNNPNKFKIGRNNSAINEEKKFWLDYHLENGTFSASRIKTAQNEEFNSIRRERPKYALHFCVNIKNVSSDSYNLSTSLHLNMQAPIEKLCHTYTKGLNYRDIYNSAAVVMNNKTGEVVAYVGSNDFFDYEHAGQVDGVKAIRSPGSALKSVVYMMAMEEGLITPKTKILDIPMDFGLYSPENFDRNFSGWVSAEDALARSLNVPAVYLLNHLSKNDFASKLIQMNFEKVGENKKEIGLSAVLGACGVTLEELCGMYRCIANKGIYSKPKYLKDSTQLKRDTVFNPLATQMVAKMLTQLERPDYPLSYQYSNDLPEIAWKTGTSYGRKDAWSIGFTKKYTVAVWAGNFDNKGAATLTGASVATPLLFDIFRILEKIDPSGKFEWTEIPERDVCSVTGQKAGKYCSKMTDGYIPFVSSNEECTHISDIFVSKDGKYEYCLDCLPESGYKTMQAESYPPELIDFYKSQNIKYKERLPHNPKCTRYSKENNPSITSPIASQEYIAEKGQFKLELSAVIAQDAKEMTWFVDNLKVGSCKSDEKIFYTPETSSTKKITCTDNLGRSASIWVKVTVY